MSFLITTGVQEQLLQLFTDLHPLANRQNAEDYIARLSQVDTQFGQLVDGLKRREAEGVIMPRFLIPWVLGDIQDMAQSEPLDTPFYKALAEKTTGLTDLSAAEQDALLAAAEKEIVQSVLPAYRALADYLEDLQKKATNDAGVWKFPNGDAYYASPPPVPGAQAGASIASWSRDLGGGAILHSRVAPVKSRLPIWKAWMTASLQTSRANHDQG